MVIIVPRIKEYAISKKHGRSLLASSLNSSQTLTASHTSQHIHLNLKC